MVGALPPPLAILAGWLVWKACSSILVFRTRHCLLDAANGVRRAYSKKTVQLAPYELLLQGLIQPSGSIWVVDYCLIGASHMSRGHVIFLFDAAEAMSMLAQHSETPVLLLVVSWWHMLCTCPCPNVVANHILLVADKVGATQFGIAGSARSGVHAREVAALLPMDRCGGYWQVGAAHPSSVAPHNPRLLDMASEGEESPNDLELKAQFYDFLAAVPMSEISTA
mmetsp:Transcript_55781/g.103188  ORF Transcript_55781/g.103188 Transcript_55781/m.103188 type:complete len:224 (+) Transcript_55781:131-802(+)